MRRWCPFVRRHRVYLRCAIEQAGLNKSLATLYPSSFRVRKLYFHWLTRGQSSLQWFAEEISSLAALDSASVNATS